MTRTGARYPAGIRAVNFGNEAAFINTWNDPAQRIIANMPDVLPAVLVQDADKPQKFHPARTLEGQGYAFSVAEHTAFREGFAKVQKLCPVIQPHTMRCAAVAETGMAAGE